MKNNHISSPDLGPRLKVVEKAKSNLLVVSSCGKTGDVEEA